jgi:hypothetical protein
MNKISLKMSLLTMPLFNSQTSKSSGITGISQIERQTVVSAKSKRSTMSVFSNMHTKQQDIFENKSVKPKLSDR